MHETADVVVVGAGAVGACAAYELALRGARVRVVDQGSRPAAGCSRANAGLLTPSHSEPLTGAGNIRTGIRQLLHKDSAFHIRPSPRLAPWLGRFAKASQPDRVRAATRLLRDLGAASLRRHAEYRESGLDTSFERRGLLDVFATAESLATSRASLERNPLDLDYDVLTEDGVRELAPGLANTAGGIAFRHEAHCDSRVFVEGVLAAAEELGTQVSLGARVRCLVHDPGRVRGVETDSETIYADQVVVAAGHLSGSLMRPLGPRLPLTPAKGYVIDLATAAGDPELPVGLKEDLVVLTPYPDRLRLAGTLELVGADTRIDARRAAAVRAAAERAFPRLRERPTLSAWAGLRPCSADGLPIIGPASSVEGVTVATGHGQQGLLLAPVTGQVVANQIIGSDGPVPTAVADGVAASRFDRTRFSL